MKIVAIIQSRLTSSRLPGKVLISIDCKPILKYIIDRVSLCKLVESSLIATSIEESDDPIELFCKAVNIKCYRGSLENVALRMFKAAKEVKSEAFVRINGDSPLIDPAIIDRAINIYNNGNYDLVTNTFPRSFPTGQSVEVIRVNTFEKIINKMTLPDEFEHMTKYYYHHPDKYNIINFENKYGNYNHLRLTVDTYEDLERVNKIILAMDKPHMEYGLREIIRIYPE